LSNWRAVPLFTPRRKVYLDNALSPSYNRAHYEIGSLLHDYGDVYLPAFREEFALEMMQPNQKG
jgi:hypothetical protein